MSDLQDDPATEAAQKELTLVLPAANELFIDIDNPADMATYVKMFECLRGNGIQIVEKKRTVSPGGNTHIYCEVELPHGPLDDTTRILLQACLGSDRHREVLSFLRIALHLLQPPTVFFERPSVVAPETARSAAPAAYEDTAF